MTVEQRIKRHLFLEAVKEFNGEIVWSDEITADNVEDAWQLLVDKDAHYDYLQDFRRRGIDSGLPSQSSRHYECKEKALQLSDGTWVGWTYWYGDGKWGEPGAIDWIEEAYELDVTEETVIVKSFKKKG